MKFEAYYVGIEPSLQPLDDEPLHYATAINHEVHNLKVVVGCEQAACIFDQQQDVQPICMLSGAVTNEQEKKHSYDEREGEVEKASFSSLVFSASGEVGLNVDKHMGYELAIVVACIGMCFSGGSSRKRAD